MKIRIKGNSVRIRLTKSEVTLFTEEGYVEEITDFGNSILRYAVKSADVENMFADFNNRGIILYVPKHLIKKWANTEQVSIGYDMTVSNGDFLHLLLEKDFKCIEPVTTEDQSDYFENPSNSC